MTEIIIKMEREEALACCIALDREGLQKYGWFKSALAKLDEAMGFKTEEAKKQRGAGI